MPGCLEVAVFGLPSERYGEEVAAMIVCTSENALNASEVQEHCKRHLANFKVPQTVIFSDQPLPRNATKKPLKRQIKQQYLANQKANADA